MSKQHTFGKSVGFARHICFDVNCVATMGGTAFFGAWFRLRTFCFAKKEKIMKSKLLTTLLTIFALSTCLFTLTACGDSQHKHLFFKQIISPTCTQQGYMANTCECGNAYKDAFVNALGHSFTNYVSNNDATVDADGTKTANCDRDGCNETDTIIVAGSKFIPSQGLEYTLNNGGQSYSVTGIGTCTDTNIVISSTYENRPVTKIGDWAFGGCYSLTSIEIPNSVISIGDWAFYDCKSLTSIEIPNSVTSIDNFAFNGCNRLVEVINKSTCITVTKGAYDNGLVGLYALTVYNSSTAITESQLTNDNGYIICTTGSEKILLNYTGTETNLTIPNYITKIYNYAFYRCKNLTSIEMSNSVRYIGYNAFYWCESLTSIKLPNNITSIGNSAFSGCSSLTKIEIPNSVTSIGENSFFHCNDLTSVTNGNGVTTIEESAFAYCDNLTNLKYRGTESQWLAISKGTNWNNGTGNYSITYNYTGN